jgi:hypothetical protein
MATAKSKVTAKRPAKKAVRKVKAKVNKIGNLDLGKYLDDIKIGNLSLDDVLEGGSKNLDALAAANRAMLDGYVDLAKRQYEMLKDLFEEARKLGGAKSDVAKELKGLLDLAKKDVQTLQKMASKTNSEAQKILKKRTDANIKAWKKLVADAKRAVSKAEPAAKKAVAKKAPAKKAVAKKVVAKKKAVKKAVRKAAPKKAAT